MLVCSPSPQTTPDSPRLASQLRSSGAPYSPSSSSWGSGDSGWRQHTCSCLAHCDVVARRCSWPEHVVLSTAAEYSFNTSNTVKSILTGGAVLLRPPRVEEAGAVYDDGVALVAVVVGDAVVALARPLRALALLAPGQHLHLGVGAALTMG